MARQIFLLASGTVFALAYALPLLGAPLEWARRFGWKIGTETGLTVYFGRCLGAVACGIIFLAVRAAFEPESHGDVFLLIGVVSALMTGLHIVGALERRQPPIETAEIPLYALMTALAFVLRP